MKAKILLVEDDFNFGNVLKNYLELNDYQVSLARDGAAGFDAYSKGGCDLIILDVMMPKMDGFSLAKQIREVDKLTPLFFLTAKGMKEDMITGYRVGADDFLTKPFDTDVLLYKMQNVLNRSMGHAALEGRDNFTIGIFHFDYKLRNISTDGESHILSPKEAELLRLLCIHENDLLPRSKALKLIWGEDTYFNGRSMDVFITKLRKYLKKDPNIEIVSLHGKGIRLMISGK